MATFWQLGCIALREKCAYVILVINDIIEKRLCDPPLT